MDKFDRIFQLHTVPRARRTGLSLEDLIKRLECLHSTFLQTVTALRYKLGAPIAFDAQVGGLSLRGGWQWGDLRVAGHLVPPLEVQALAIVRRLLLEERAAAFSRSM